MKRKIVQHGSSSLTITLPIKWAEKFNLKKGEELFVEEQGSNLLISTQNETNKSKKTISTRDGIFTKNNISHLYQLGYDEIEVLYDDNQTIEEIKARLPNCIGFEIIDQKENKITIKSIATTIETEFDMLLRKSFFIVNDMAKSMLEAMKKNHLEKLKDIRSMEVLNNKFTDVCIRILNKRGYPDAKKTMQMYEVVKNIERIADEFKYICDLFSNSQENLDQKSVKDFEKTVNYYLAYHDMFFKFNPSLKEKIFKDRKRLTNEFQESMKNTKGNRTMLYHNLINIVQKTYEGAGAYFSLVL